MTFKERHLLEEIHFSPVLKGAALAGLGGAVGAGLDVYFNGGRNINEFIKPVAAWSLGGALGGLSSGNKSNTSKVIKNKVEKE